MPGTRRSPVLGRQPLDWRTGSRRLGAVGREGSSDGPGAIEGETMTIDELARRAGTTTRNVRALPNKGLAAPARDGRPSRPLRQPVDRDQLATVFPEITGSPDVLGRTASIPRQTAQFFSAADGAT
jgi:hypothetical protein